MRNIMCAVLLHFRCFSSSVTGTRLSRKVYDPLMEGAYVLALDGIERCEHIARTPTIFTLDPGA